MLLTLIRTCLNRVLFFPRRGPTMPARQAPSGQADGNLTGYRAPHCDSAILHAPGECEYCDWFPAYQRYRTLAGIAFTGHEPLVGEAPCPSPQRRPIATINRWPGNRPMPTYRDGEAASSWPMSDPDRPSPVLFGDRPVDIDGTPASGPPYSGH